MGFISHRPSLADALLKELKKILGGSQPSLYGDDWGKTPWPPSKPHTPVPHPPSPRPTPPWPSDRVRHCKEK